MAKPANLLIDVTIPGLSPRDLVGRAAKAFQTTHAAVVDHARILHHDMALKRALYDLDVRQLQDIGLDRNAC